ncbi:hypothetical protein G7Z17_g12086 [Cylindrodendrum hubeiense]|uniref:Uncharacterized protein n=1 Tax=Cylindrodendrum hubeiense TaxID=595255 RepID=A0A9P5LAZ6_9HYPO|nr:hypothetical protein G7Z17_g12086 [Cylindrodendrum hubeiense]
MGNICGKTESDAFDQPGRVLGSAPPPGPATAPVPKRVGGPPRVLGGSSIVEAPGNQEDARRKASEAALAHPYYGRELYAPSADDRGTPPPPPVPFKPHIVKAHCGICYPLSDPRFQARAKASSAGGGKLQTQLTSQQKKSQLEHLNDASKTQRGENQSAQATEIQRWD